MRGHEGLKTVKIDRESRPDLSSEVYHVIDMPRSSDPSMEVHIYRIHPMTKLAIYTNAMFHTPNIHLLNRVTRAIKF